MTTSPGDWIQGSPSTCTGMSVLILILICESRRERETDSQSVTAAGKASEREREREIARVAGSPGARVSAEHQGSSTRGKRWRERERDLRDLPVRCESRSAAQTVSVPCARRRALQRPPASRRNESASGTDPPSRVPRGSLRIPSCECVSARSVHPDSHARRRWWCSERVTFAERETTRKE